MLKNENSETSEPLSTIALIIEIDSSFEYLLFLILIFLYNLDKNDSHRNDNTYTNIFYIVG